MTKEAQAVADAIQQVWWDWGNMEPSHPNVIAVATLRKVVEELKWIGITEKNILELANKLEMPELEEQPLKEQVEFYKNRGGDAVLITNMRTKMTEPRIKVKETQHYYGNFDGKLEDIIASLQAELDAGWEGIESEYCQDYGYEYYLYKFREENDQEYEKRMKQLEKEKVEKAKSKERKLEKLKKDLASLSDADKKLLGL